MAFHRLLTSNFGKIVLLNLYYTAKATPRVIEDKLLLQGLKDIATALKSYSRPLDGEPAISDAIGKTLYTKASRIQVQGEQKPDKNIKISVVCPLDKMVRMLEWIGQRNSCPDIIDTLLAADAPDDTVAKAADLINKHAKRIPDYMLGDWGTILWAAPTKEIERLQAKCSASLGCVSRSDQATHLRDALGLIQMNPDITSLGRHLFLFHGQATIQEWEVDYDIKYARPTTFDGWSNPRFCQPILLTPPNLPGCGLTIDISGFKLNPGSAEMVLTPISGKLFKCEYIGPIKGSEFGKHEDYITLLSGGQSLSDCAAELEKMIA